MVLYFKNINNVVDLDIYLIRAQAYIGRLGGRRVWAQGYHGSVAIKDIVAKFKELCPNLDLNEAPELAERIKALDLKAKSLLKNATPTQKKLTSIRRAIGGKFDRKGFAADTYKDHFPNSRIFAKAITSWYKELTTKERNFWKKNLPDAHESLKKLFNSINKNKDFNLNEFEKFVSDEISMFYKNNRKSMSTLVSLYSKFQEKMLEGGAVFFDSRKRKISPDVFKQNLLRCRVLAGFLSELSEVEYNRIGNEGKEALRSLVLYADLTDNDLLIHLNKLSGQASWQLRGRLCAYALNQTKLIKERNLENRINSFINYELSKEEHDTLLKIDVVLALYSLLNYENTSGEIKFGFDWVIERVKEKINENDPLYSKAIDFFEGECKKL